MRLALRGGATFLGFAKKQKEGTDIFLAFECLKSSIRNKSE